MGFLLENHVIIGTKYIHLSLFQGADRFPAGKVLKSLNGPPSATTVSLEGKV